VTPETPAKPVTGLLRWLRAITAADLGSKEKLVLFAYARFANWKTGVAYPSVPTLARAASLSDRSIQSACGTLRRHRVLLDLRQPRGGLGRKGYGFTNLVQLDVTALEALTKGAIGDIEGCNTCTGTVQDSAEKGAPFAPKQTNQNHPSALATRTHQPTAGPECARASGGGLAGGAGDVRGLLQRCGVSPKVRAQLVAAPGITAAEVQAEWTSISGDRTVANPVGVLVHRLCERYGVVRQRTSELDKEINRQVMRLRMNRMRGYGGSHP